MIEQQRELTQESSYKTIPPQSGTAFVLRKGEFLRVEDIEGEQVSDLFCFNLFDTNEFLSSGRTFDFNDTIYPTIGHKLISNRENPMLEIIEDTCGTHDFIYTPCSLKTFKATLKDDKWHPSCLENLGKSFREFSISENLIGTTFNIFMNVELAPNGSLNIKNPKSHPGDYILFQASMDLIVGLTACSDEATNNYKFKPIRYEIQQTQ